MTQTSLLVLICPSLIIPDSLCISVCLWLLSLVHVHFLPTLSLLAKEQSQTFAQMLDIERTWHIPSGLAQVQLSLQGSPREEVALGQSSSREQVLKEEACTQLQ